MIDISEVKPRLSSLPSKASKTNQNRYKSGGDHLPIWTR